MFMFDAVGLPPPLLRPPQHVCVFYALFRFPPQIFTPGPTVSIWGIYAIWQGHLFMMGYFLFTYYLWRLSWICYRGSCGYSGRGTLFRFGYNKSNHKIEVFCAVVFFFLIKLTNRASSLFKFQSSPVGSVMK